MKYLVNFLIVSLALFSAGLIGAATVIYFGLYNISALYQHTAPVYTIFNIARIQALKTRSPQEVPELQQMDWQQSGLRLYEKHCVQCHGAPGVAPHSFSLGMKPAPSSIVKISRDRTAAEIFWVIKNGIKMSGMPAWEYRLGEEQLWQLTALITNLQSLSVSEYFLMRDELQPIPPSGVAADEFVSPINSKTVSPSHRSKIEAGKIALQQYNCSSCHAIQGISSAHNYLGPPLDGITQRGFIAGLLQYSDENLERWIRFPQTIDPHSAMPNLGVTELHAEQMIAYFKFIETQ